MGILKWGVEVWGRCCCPTSIIKKHVMGIGESPAAQGYPNGKLHLTRQCFFAHEQTKHRGNLVSNERFDPTADPLNRVVVEIQPRRDGFTPASRVVPDRPNAPLSQFAPITPNSGTYPHAVVSAMSRQTINRSTWLRFCLTPIPKILT